MGRKFISGCPVHIVEGDPNELDIVDDPEESDEESIDQRAQETMVVKRPASKDNLATAKDSNPEASNVSATDDTNNDSTASPASDDSSAQDSANSETSMDEVHEGVEQSSDSAVSIPMTLTHPKLTKPPMTYRCYPN